MGNRVISSRRAWLATISIALGVFAGAACTSTSAPGSNPSADPPQADGPLRSTTIDGGISVFPPKDARTWSATFGFATVCIQGAKDVVIQDVQLKLENDPLSSRTYLRSVPAKDQRVGTGDWLPIGSRVGTPEHFADPPHVGRGEFTDSKGARVTAPCGPDKSANAFQELVTVMEIGEAGARSNELEVNYTADGTPAVLVVPYTYVACGTAISDPDYCPS